MNSLTVTYDSMHNTYPEFRTFPLVTYRNKQLLQKSRRVIVVSKLVRILMKQRKRFGLAKSFRTQFNFECLTYLYQCSSISNGLYPTVVCITSISGYIKWSTNFLADIYFWFKYITRLYKTIKLEWTNFESSKR